MHVVVAGGAGYIGSHMVKALVRQGHQVTVFDNLSTGHADAVHGAKLVQGELSSGADLAGVLKGADAVMQFAANIEVGESIGNPAKYYRNNFANTLNLLSAMVEHGVKKLVFSSTAAIFGTPRYVPIDEKHPIDPINPYGAAKAMVERMLPDFDSAHGLKYMALRYFNACGADPEGELGERHDPESHLIPIILQVASGRRASVQIYGTDYGTPDGTCIRDYIHVTDLCDAHLLALERLADGKSDCYNLGNGNGFSVREVIAAVERVTGRKINAVEAPRRGGDPERLVADSARAKAELRWTPKCADLDTIVAHAWAWEQKSAGKRN